MNGLNWGKKKKKTFRFIGWPLVACTCKRGWSYFQSPAGNFFFFLFRILNAGGLSACAQVERIFFFFFFFVKDALARHAHFYFICWRWCGGGTFGRKEGRNGGTEEGCDLFLQRQQIFIPGIYKTRTAQLFSLLFRSLPLGPYIFLFFLGFIF